MNHITRGFHTPNHPLFKPEVPESVGTVYNIITAMDYIPGISVISGLAKIILGSTALSNADFNDKNAKYFACGIITRGIISTLCLGIFLAPFDLYVTFSTPKKEDSSSKDVLPEIFSGTE